MESKEDFWMDKHASASIRRGLSSTSVLENQGSGDFSSRDGSLPSCSSSSSARNSSTDLIDGAAKAIAILEDGEVGTMLQDAKIRAVLRKVTINEGVLNKAIQSLGGGKKGLKSLMEYIMVWMKQQRDIKSSSQQPPLSPPSNAEDVVLRPSSDAFQILSGSLPPPPTTQLLDQGVRNTPRLKSCKLMTGEPEMGAGLGVLETGISPSSFMRSPEDYKPEVTRPDIMAPCIPELNYGMQQQQPVPPLTSAHIATLSVERTPAMTTKAARRHRMTRHRQSFRARAASPVATTPVSVGGGLLWNTNAPAMTNSGMSRAQTTPRSAPVTAAREGRSMEGLTVLLQKELRTSDVDHLGRIELPKKAAEQCMPSLATLGGVSIQMEDFDLGHVWNLRYRFWPNNESQMHILENTEAFVISHGLVEGDLFVIYKTLQGGYVLRGIKKNKGRLDPNPVQVEFAHSSAKGSLEGQPSPHETGTLVQRLYGGCPLDDSVKEEPVNLDDDPFLNEVILSMGPSFESESSCVQPLERFPSLTLDFPLEEMMAVTRAEPDGRYQHSGCK